MTLSRLHWRHHVAFFTQADSVTLLQPHEVASLKIPLVFLSVVVGACATSSNELVDIQDVETLLKKADKLAPACLIQIDEPTHCGLASCEWPDSFERCFGGESPTHDIILQRRSFDKATCMAFDEALQPALTPLNACSNDKALLGDPTLENYCRDYVRSLTSSCAGYTGYVLAISDAQLSADYRDEMISEAPRSEIIERIEGRLVRYRPEK